jgi:hypothetical protein
MEVKLKKYTIHRSGTRGLTVCLPQNWIDLQNLKQRDQLLFSQDDKGRLIIEKVGPEGGAA